MHQNKGRVTPNRNASRNVYVNIRCNSPLDLVLTCLARHDVLLCLFPGKLCFLLFTIERPLLNMPTSCWWCFLSEHFSEFADNISLRKQPSFFAPGPSGVSREGRLRFTAENSILMTRICPHLVRSADWFDRQLWIIKSGKYAGH